MEIAVPGEGGVVDDRSILLVEDSLDVGELVALILREQYHPVDWVTTAEDALIRVTQQRPRLVLLDLQLPGMSGVDFLTRCRENPGTADIPIIVITAASLSLLDECPAADAILLKPFAIDDLYGLVDAVLSRSAPTEPAATG